jgi:enoyl-[acyl-carrier-protein] reductase (NADH)
MGFPKNYRVMGGGEKPPKTSDALLGGNELGPRIRVNTISAGPIKRLVPACQGLDRFMDKMRKSSAPAPLTVVKWGDTTDFFPSP